ARGLDEGIRPQDQKLGWDRLVGIAQNNPDSPGCRLNRNHPGCYVPVPSPKLQSNPLMRFPPAGSDSLPCTQRLRPPDNFRLSSLSADPFQQSSIPPMMSLSDSRRCHDISDLRLTIDDFNRDQSSMVNRQPGVMTNVWSRTRIFQIYDWRFQPRSIVNRKSSIVNLLIQPAEVRGISGRDRDGDDFRNLVGVELSDS